VADKTELPLVFLTDEFDLVGSVLHGGGATPHACACLACPPALGLPACSCTCIDWLLANGFECSEGHPHGNPPIAVQPVPYESDVTYGGILDSDAELEEVRRPVGTAADTSSSRLAGGSLCASMVCPVHSLGPLRWRPPCSWPSVASAASAPGRTRWWSTRLTASTSTPL
jgi:hypothetical protein